MNNITAKYKKRILLPLDILEKPQKGLDNTEQALTRVATIIDGAFGTFDIESKVCEIAVGPQFLRYRVEIESKTPLDDVVGLSGDIAMALELSEQEVIIYKDLETIASVFVQIPNPHPYYLYLRKWIAQEYDWEEEDGLPIILGQSLEGKIEGCDLKKIKNLLIAGVSATGKTTLLYSLIANLLFKKTSKELKFLIIDPKITSVEVFEGLPSLLLPVASSEAEITKSLEYLNKLIKERVKNVGKEMSNIVVIIDEFSDLMLNGKAEDLYQIIEKGEKLGIYVILTTSCISEKVLTEKLKKLIPSRVAFALSSAADSRIIINERGAMNLVGNGDMLYKENFYSIPKRLQGIYISDIDMGKVVEYLKAIEE